MTLAYLGLGANLGEVEQTLLDCITCLAQHEGITVLQRSSIYRTKPVDTEGPDFANAVVSIETTLTAEKLHEICMDIELQFGRKRLYRYAPRTLDIDLLLFGDQIIALPTLTVPHPRMVERAFVLIPLAEIASSIMIPGYGLIDKYLPTVAHQDIGKVILNDCTHCLTQ